MKHGHGAENTQYVQPANLKGELNGRMNTVFTVVWSVELPSFIWLLEIGQIGGTIPLTLTRSLT